MLSKKVGFHNICSDASRAGTRTALSRGRALPSSSISFLSLSATKHKNSGFMRNTRQSVLISCQDSEEHKTKYGSAAACGELAAHRNQWKDEVVHWCCVMLTAVQTQGGQAPSHLPRHAQRPGAHTRPSLPPHQLKTVITTRITKRRQFVI